MHLCCFENSIEKMLVREQLKVSHKNSFIFAYCCFDLIISSIPNLASIPKTNTRKSTKFMAFILMAFILVLKVFGGLDLLKESLYMSSCPL